MVDTFTQYVCIQFILLILTNIEGRAVIQACNDLLQNWHEKHALNRFGTSNKNA